MDKLGGIYRIRNTINGKRYIGSAVQFAQRWKKHRLDLRHGCHHSIALQRAWNKYGENNFAFEPLLICDKQDLIPHEQLALDGLRPEYNSNPIAGSRLGAKLTPAQLVAHSGRMRARWEKDPTKMRSLTVATQFKDGHETPLETRQKISATKMGSKIQYPKNRKSRGPHSLEVREKIARAQRGVPKPKPSEATRLKLRAAQKARRTREATNGY